MAGITRWSLDKRLCGRLLAGADIRGISVLEEGDGCPQPGILDPTNPTLYSKPEKVGYKPFRPYR